MRASKVDRHRHTERACCLYVCAQRPHTFFFVAPRDTEKLTAARTDAPTPGMGHAAALRVIGQA